jgi:hypothetical protein
MTLNEHKKLSKHIFRLLKVNDITFPIGLTSSGNLGINFNANNEDWTIMLDSIPLPTANSLTDENNIELKAMIEKYYFEPESVVSFTQFKPLEVTDDSIESGFESLPENMVSHAKVPAKKVTKTKK